MSPTPKQTSPLRDASRQGHWLGLGLGWAGRWARFEEDGQGLGLRVGEVGEDGQGLWLGCAGERCEKDGVVGGGLLESEVEEVEI